MLDNPIALYALMAALLLTGAYIIYHILRPKSPPPKTAQRDQRADLDRVVDDTLRAAGIESTGAALELGGSRPSNEAVTDEVEETARRTLEEMRRRRP